MKLKDFLRSNSFKCIVVLLVIALVCGAVLAFCNDLFYVSDEEMFARSIVKIYDGDASELTDLIESEDDQVTYTSYNAQAVILDALVAADGETWLVQSRGTGGYQNGTVTIWVNMTAEGVALTAINKVIVDSNDGQTLINSFDDDFLATYASEEYADVVSGGGHFTNQRMTSDSTPETEVVVSGATYTSRAINAAVNGAMDYVRERAGEGV